MTSQESNVAAQPGRSAAANNRDRNLRRWWSAITILLAVAVFIEVLFAGAMLSGVDWARMAHRVTAAILVASALTAGLVSIVRLRHVPHGPALGLMLLSLAAALFLQAAVGALSAKGANLLWLHVPLGVALFAFARQAVTSARTLPTE